MAVQERQKRGGIYQCFSARVEKDTYNSLTDWAWLHRLSLAKACAILLTKALAAEQGEGYVPEREVAQIGSAGA